MYNLYVYCIALDGYCNVTFQQRHSKHVTVIALLPRNLIHFKWLAE
jgi:hypothetical protein